MVHRCTLDIILYITVKNLAQKRSLAQTELLLKGIFEGLLLTHLVYNNVVYI